MVKALKINLENDANLLQLFGIEGVGCPKCGSNNIMHWGIEKLIDAETDEYCGFEYVYECRENSPYHNNKPYMFYEKLEALEESYLKYYHLIENKE